MSLKKASNAVREAPAKVQSLPAPEISVLAAALRRLRAAAGLTLKDLGERSGIATSTLSKIENGHLSPTYEKIVALADALGADIAELFGRGDSPAASGRRGVCRKGDGIKHATEQYVYEMLCSDLSHKQFVPIVTQLRAHSIGEFPGLLKHQGEEFIYVIEGEVVLHTEFYAPLRLLVGDSCYFDSAMGHACVSAGAIDAKILWVCSRNTPMPVPIPR